MREPIGQIPGGRRSKAASPGVMGCRVIENDSDNRISCHFSSMDPGFFMPASFLSPASRPLRTQRKKKLLGGINKRGLALRSLRTPGEKKVFIFCWSECAGRRVLFRGLGLVRTSAGETCRAYGKRRHVAALQSVYVEAMNANPAI